MRDSRLSFFFPLLAPFSFIYDSYWWKIDVLFVNIAEEEKSSLKKKNRKGRKYFQTRKKNFFRIYGNVNLIMTGSWNVGIRFSCIVFPIYDRETGCDQRQLRCWL